MSRTNPSLAEAVAPARRRHHTLVEAAREWAAERRVWLPPDLVALIVAAAQDGRAMGADRRPDDAAPGTYWSRVSVNALLMHDVPDWCERRSVAWPFALPESIWRYLDFLVATDRLDPASDPLPELRRPLRCFGQLGVDGRWDPEAVVDPGPCICYQRYDGPSHGELRAPGEGG